MKHKLHRLKILFRALPARLALKFALSETVRVVFNPHAFASYSQYGEDRLITKLFDLRQPGFYVDVGCNDPLRFSNTLEFYLQGWAGVCIDGNEQLIANWKRTRRLDQAVCAVVSEKREDVMFELNDSNLLSRVVKPGEPITGRRMQAKSCTLESILNKHHVPKSFEFLSIDCEGCDFQVLKSFDIAVYKPKVVVIELLGHEYDDWTENPITGYLCQHGYRLVGLAGYSGVFAQKRPD